MVKKSINSINNQMKLIIDNKYNQIINKINEDFNINIETINYNDNHKSNDIQCLSELLNDMLRCQARVKSGCQCKRSKKNSTEFCKIHQKKCKFGKVKYLF